MTTLLDAKEVQARLGISESTLFRMLRNKEIAGLRIGKRGLRFAEEDIEAYIRQQRQKARADSHKLLREE